MRTGEATTPADDTVLVFLSERPQLHRLARRITRSGQDADDVVQDVWVRFDTHRHDVVNPGAWLRTVTSRAAIDCLRRRAGRQELPRDPVELPEPETPGPDDVVVRQERVAEAAHRLLTRLSPLERVVLVGREFCALGYGELATLLGRSEVAVRQLRHRATQHLAGPGARFVPAPAEIDQLSRRLWHARQTGQVDGVLDHLLAAVSPASCPALHTAM